MATLFDFGFTGTVRADKRPSSSDSENDTLDSEKPPRKKPTRRFQKKWMDTWKWVCYDEEKGVMYCATCRQVSKFVFLCVL